MARAHRLKPLLAPSSIAVVGGRHAELSAIQCDLLGFEGEVWVVNPHRTELAGRPAVPAVADLPGPPDAAFVAVNRNLTVEIVRELADIGAGGVVCYAAGFAEAGEPGRVLQDELMAAAGSMPVVGPNCYGIVNALDGVALWPDQQGCRRIDSGVAFITQSGNMGLNLTMQRRGLPISHVITVGNQASVGIEECMEAVLDDSRVVAIGLHVESLTDTAWFADVAMRAATRHLPVVALKTGASTVGAAITESHTASLAGAHEAYRALFERYGVVAVDTVPQLLETLQLVTSIGPLAGKRLASLSCSGGEASLVADLARDRDLDFPQFDAERSAAIAATLPPETSVTNPLDYPTTMWGDGERLTACFTEVMRSPIDAAMVVLDFPHQDDEAWWTTVEAFRAARDTTEVPVAVVATLPELLPADASRRLAESGIAPLHGLGEGLRALDEAARLGAFYESDGPAPHLVPEPGGATALPLGEAEAKDRLSAVGVAVPNAVVTAAGDAVAAAASIGYPVVVKALGLEHKSDFGAVATGLQRPHEVAAAAAAIGHDRLLVETHVVDVIAELLVSVRREPAVGLLVTIGNGGEYVELLNDRAHLLAPASPESIRAALLNLDVGSVLAGYRNRPGGDVAAVVDAISAIVELATNDPEVIEVEVNPLLVLAAGAVAADASIWVEGS